MSDLVPLVVFSFVNAGSPGPNNLLLWASGVQFGVRPTLSHVLGTALGVGSIALAVAAGIGVLVSSVPGVETALKIAGSLYLLYLAYRIAGGRVSGDTEVTRPLTLWQAAVFQAVNAKVWIFALAAMGTFRPADLPVALGSLVTAATMMAVVLATAVLWAAGGGLIGGLVRSGRAQRLVSAALALLLVASVAQLWR